MADTKNAATETAGNSAKDKFEIKLNQTIDFDAVEKQQLITSRDFCSRYVNPLFKPVYADYLGSTFDVDQRGDQVISLYFDRRDHGDDVTATTRVPVSNDGMINESVNHVRRYTNRALNGDKFYMTTQGQEGIEKFFYGNIAHKRTRDGIKVDWEKVKTTTAQNGGNPYTQPGQQMTKISFINPVKIVETIFGTGSADDQVDYTIVVARSIMNNGFIQNGAMSSNYLLRIIALNRNAVDKMASDFGVIGGGLDIIRS